MSARTLPPIEAEVFRRVAIGTDPWDGGRSRVGSRWASQALSRLQRKKLVDLRYNDDNEPAWMLTDAGRDLAALPKCQAEDMGGWPACDSPAEFQTKVEPRRFYCAGHRKNRHVWRPKEELEPMVTSAERASAGRQA